MSAFTIIPVEIVRPATSGQANGVGSGMVRTATGGYRLPDAGVAPVPAVSPTGDSPAVPGSPFPCRYYHKKAEYAEGQRVESEQGVALIDVQHAIKVEQPGADVRIGDIALMPIGTVYADRPCRAKIVKTRLYGNGIQCDIETGVV